MAGTTKEIELEENNTQTRPLSIADEPTTHQTDATISITHVQTGMPVHSMIYAGTDKIEINLANELEGTYTLHLNIEGTEYTGYFIR